MKIEPGKVVMLSYELYRKSGELFESSEEEPIEFVQGEGDVLPGLEAALDGQDEAAANPSQPGTFSHSSSVMNGIIGCSMRSKPEST